MRGHFKIVRDLNLPAGDFAIFGSGPLIIRELITGSNDLDIICRGAAWEKVQSLGQVKYLPEYDVSIVAIGGDDITFGNQWGIGNPDIDALIDDAEMIEDLPFVQLRHVIDYKLLRASRKDLSHIEILEKAGFGELVSKAREDADR